ncbi:SGNH/GDSL hydrolase family protein [Pseudomonas sp. HK3]|jgi:lysophospholipase L1-like esterase
MLYARYLLQLSWYLLTPLFLLCVPQALYIKKTALRLPEAQGDTCVRHGTHEPTLTFLHFGESTVAGVGVKELSQGLSAQLCYALSNELSTRNNMSVECKITGQNGIRFGGINECIKRNKRSADFAIITMGVNDTTGLTSIKQWHHGIQDSIQALNNQGIKIVLFTQVPPMAQFPALPAPFKYLLGLRAYLLDFELQRLCQRNEGCHYVGSKLVVAKEMMAEDGYHPSALGYKAWAEQITPQILQHLRR